MIAVSDQKNITWLPDEHITLSAFLRQIGDQSLFCLFNFGSKPIYISWYIFKEHVQTGTVLVDHWNKNQLIVGHDEANFIIPAFGIGDR
jgi:hypothetical protein